MIYKNFVFIISTIQNYQYRVIRFCVNSIPHRDKRERVVCKKRAAILFSDGRSRKTNGDIFIAREIKHNRDCDVRSCTPFLISSTLFFHCHCISRFPVDDNAFLFFCIYIVFLPINKIFIKHIFESFYKI